MDLHNLDIFIGRRTVPIKMNCPSCGKTLSAPDTATGKKAKCPSCGQVMIVPEAVQEAEDIYAAAPEPFTSFTPQPPAESPQAWSGSPAGPAPEPPASSPGGKASPGGEARRPCPECGEMIVAGAAKCRFCNAIFDPRLKAKTIRQQWSASDEDLTTGDWVFCIICSGLACIFGIVYAIQGKPKGMKMVGISFNVPLNYWFFKISCSNVRSNRRRFFSSDFVA